MKDIEFELLMAAFAKMVRGEVLSIGDWQRVVAAFIDNPPRMDTQNQAQAQQLMAQAKDGIQRVYFGNQ